MHMRMFLVLMSYIFPMEEMHVKKSRVYLLPVIHGLAGEEKKVEEAFKKINPDCIAIGIAPEDVEMIEKVNEQEDFELSLQHQYYLMHLSKYGKVVIPPSDIKMAHKIAKDNNLPLCPIDIDDNEYAELLTQNVSIFALIRHSRKIKRLAKKDFKAKNAEEFVFEWDKEINSIKSFRKIEDIRERRMAENLAKLCKSYKKILAIIPLEKLNGIKNELERYKK